MFGKLLRSLRGGSARAAHRQVRHLGDVLPGDLISFKPRRLLPPSLQGETVEVSQVTTYQYEGAVCWQLDLVDTHRQRLYLSFERDCPDGQLCLSKPISRHDVQRLFGESQFGLLWEPGYCELVAQTQPAELDGWLARRYTQTANFSEGYLLTEKVSGPVSSQEDDGSEPFRYHECEGDDDAYGLSVEVWADGDTDIALDLTVSADVVERIWPADG